MDVDNKKALEAIKTSYKKGRLHPFVGAGFSKNAKLINGKKYPDWPQFIHYLYGQEKSLFKDPLLATEYWITQKIASSRLRLQSNGWRKECRKTLGEKVKKYFKTLKIRKSNNRVSKPHEILVNKFDTIYTSNWDDLLEESFNCAGKDTYAVFYRYRHFHMKSMLGKKSKIIKIHGCVSGNRGNRNYESLVGMRSDYNDRMINMHPLYLNFQHAVSFHDFLFIGFSYEDPNISALLQQLNFMKTRTLTAKERKDHKIFFAMRSQGQHNRQMDAMRKMRNLFLNSFGIDIYFYTNLSGFLNNL